MIIVLNVLHRYVAPFLMGVCVAGATEVSGNASIVTLLVAAGVLGFLSLPAAARMFARFTDPVV